MGWGPPHEIIDTLEGGEAINLITLFNVGVKVHTNLWAVYQNSPLRKLWGMNGRVIPLCGHRNANTLSHCYVMNSVLLLSGDIV